MSVNCNSPEFKKLVEEEKRLRNLLKEKLASKEMRIAEEMRLRELRAKTDARPTTVAEAEARKAYREQNPIQEVIRGSMKDVGSREMMADTVVQSLRRPELDDVSPYYSNMDEMVEDTLGIHLHENTLQNLSKETRRILRGTEERLRAIVTNNRHFQISNDEQKAEIVKKLVDHLEENGKGWLKELDDETINGFWFDFDDLTGTTRVNFHMTQNNGEAFKEEAHAIFAATKFKEKSSLKGLQTEVVPYNGAWVIKAKRPLSVEEMELNKYKGLQDKVASFWAGRVLRGHDSLVDDELGSSGLLGTLERERLSAALNKEMNRAIKPMSKKQQKDMESILEETRLSGEYFEPKQLAENFLHITGRRISKAETNFYYTYKLTEEAINYSRNVGRWAELDAAGFKTVTLKNVVTQVSKKQGREIVVRDNVDTTGRLLARDEIPSDIEDYGVFSTESRSVLFSDRRELEDLFEQGYRVVELEDTFKLGRQLYDDIADVKYVLTPPKGFKENPLAFQQTKPRAGGFQNFEKVTHFVSVNPVTTLQSGKKVARAPRVLRGAKNKGQAETYANKINKGLALLRELKPTGKKTTWRDVSPERIATVNRSIKELDFQGMESMTEFRDYIRREGIDLNGGVQSSRRDSLIQPQYMDADGKAIDALNTFKSQEDALQQAQLGKNQGGLIMTDDTYAVTTSPIRAMQQQLDKAITGQAFREFKVNQTNRFKATFKDFMEDPTQDALTMATTGEMKNKKAIETLARAQLGMSPEKVMSTIRSHQAYINQVLRTDNTMDAAVKNFTYSIAEIVEDSKVLEKLSAKGHDWLTNVLYRGAEANPIDRLRSLTFNVKLGMFSPVQFLQQAQGASLAFAMSPKYGFQAAGSYIPMRMAIRLGDDAGIEHIAQKTYKLAGFKSADEFANMIKAFKQSGYADFSTSMAMADTGFNTAGSGYYGRRLKRVTELGRKPFEEGELISRITGYNIAYRRWLNNDNGVNPKNLSFDSPQGMKFLSSETDRILFSPLAHNNPLFTKGWASIPFQFWSHNAKVIGAMLPRKLGGNSKYTWQEKVKIALGGSIFYGTTHYPLATEMTNFFLEAGGVELDEVTAKQIHDGLFDTLMYVASDGKINSEVGVRWGAWSMVDQMADRYINGESTMWDFAEFLGGASGSTIRQGLIEPFKVMSMLGAWSNPSIDKVTESGITALGGVLASVGMAQRVYLAHKYNLMFDKRFGAASPITGEEAWYMLFTGAQPVASNQMFRDIAARKERTIEMEDAVKTIHTLLNKGYRSNEEDAQMYREALALYSQGLGNDRFAQDAMGLALQRMSKGGSLSEGIRYTQRMQGEQRDRLNEAKPE